MATVAVREGATTAQLVAVINKLVTLVNELKADHNGLVTKLDADAGVTDTNYASLRSIAAADADSVVVVY